MLTRAINQSELILPHPLRAITKQTSFKDQEAHLPYICLVKSIPTCFQIHQ